MLGYRRRGRETAIGKIEGGYRKGKTVYHERRKTKHFRQLPGGAVQGRLSRSCQSTELLGAGEMSKGLHVGSPCAII